MFLLSFQLKEEHSVHGSDEDVDDPLEADSDEDLSDNTVEQVLEEVFGWIYILALFLFLTITLGIS